MSCCRGPHRETGLPTPLPLENLVKKGIISDQESWTQLRHDLCPGWDAQPLWQWPFISFPFEATRGRVHPALPLDREVQRPPTPCPSGQHPSYRCLYPEPAYHSSQPMFSLPGPRVLPSGVGRKIAGQHPGQGPLLHPGTRDSWESENSNATLHL